MSEKCYQILLITKETMDASIFERRFSEDPQYKYHLIIAHSLPLIKPYLNHVDLVITRLSEETKDWVQLILKHAPHLPHIILTHSCQEEERIYFLSLGAQLYCLEKDFLEAKMIWHVLLSTIERMKLLSLMRSKNEELSNTLLAIRRGKVDMIIGDDYEKKNNKFLAVQDMNLIAKNKMLLKRLKNLAHIDHLTKIFNRLYFDDLLKRHTELSLRYHKFFALLLIDIDHFKTINDTLGHATGDHLLKLVVQRIQSCLRVEDMLARLGGDEFAVLLNQIRHTSDAGRVANKLLNIFKTPFTIDKRKIYITLSIGICCYPATSGTADDLLKNVDVALYRVKYMGGNGYQYYQEELDRSQKHLLKLESYLQEAIQKKDFYVVYQPIVDLKTEKVIYFEALLRWHHEEFGDIAPSEFIPVAEMSGKITFITDWLLQHVAKQLATWRDKYKKILPISINCSVLDIWHHHLHERLKFLIKKYNLKPSYFHIEVTETAIMHYESATLRAMHELEEMGIHISLDDFGTGYSSLSRLVDFPLCAVKIDRSFLLSMTTRENAVSIINVIILLSHQMNFKVIAEGVETREQVEFLKKQGCDYAQGYYFSKPLPCELAEKFLQR